MRNSPLLIALVMIVARFSPAAAAVAETANFVVECTDAQLGQAVAERAEQCRTELWSYWTGSPPPDNWAYKCEVLVRIANHNGGGNTSYVLDVGEAFGFEGKWEGSPERLLDCVVPHEVTHTILASHFRRPIPRAIDEGMCTAVEAAPGRNNWRQEIQAALRNRRAFPTDQLLALQEYPPDFAAMYAQGSSLVEFLLEMGSPTDLTRCVGIALDGGQWEPAFREVYGFADYLHLQESWLAWLKGGGGQVRTVGYGIHVAHQCEFLQNGELSCQQQQQQWTQPSGGRFKFLQQEPRQQREPLLPKTFAGGVGAQVTGPNGAGVAIGAGGNATQVATSCQCGPRLEAFEKELADMKDRVNALSDGVDAKLGGVVYKDQLDELVPSEPPPTLDHLATREELAEVAEQTAENHESILDRLKRIGGKAKDVAGVVVAAKETAAAGSGGLFAGVGFGWQIATLLGLGTGPAGIAAIVGAIAYRRLKKKIGAGGRRARPFRRRDPEDP